MRSQQNKFHRRQVKRRLDRVFRFYNTQIRANSRTRKSWHRFVRTQEIEIILSLVEGRRFERALEIGSGDGLQSEKLAVLCDQLVCSDVDRRRWDIRQERVLPENVSFVVQDASDLSRFPDDYFDLVYSSNALEHVEKFDNCIGEIRRVLSPSGLGIHSMPSRPWKLFNSLYRLAKFRKPAIHGVERTNCKEFVAFSLAVWVRKFETRGFVVEEIYGMPFYFGAGGRWSSVVNLGNRLSLPSSYTFFVRPNKIPE